MSAPSTGSESSEPQMLAAVDLGSNSFHLVVARVVNNQLHLLDRLKESVRLGAGLTPGGEIDPAVGERALACLRRFGQRLDALPPGSVRAVGTNTLRSARSPLPFLEHAMEALGHRIEVISGAEEARLIYLGVSHSIANGAGKRLVVDIGGGSTECVIGEGFAPLQRDSLYMGCVSYTRRFFPDGNITRESMRAAQLAAKLELRPIVQRFREMGWEQAVGASGTILAAAQVVTQNGFSQHGLSRKALRRLRKALVAHGDVDTLRLEGLSSERTPVFPAGIAILEAIFESLDLEQMEISSGALREGLLYDLLGRIRHEDVRDETVRHLAMMHRVDDAHAGRVATTAGALFRQAQTGWRLPSELRCPLLWSARLHEIGLSIAFSGYHKHGAYLLDSMDMPGFSREDQRLISSLVRHHRRRLRRDRYQGLGSWNKVVLRLTVLLRLACLLHRDRSAAPLPPFALAVAKERIQLSFPEGWLETHPLTGGDLAAEAEALAQAGFVLQSS